MKRADRDLKGFSLNLLGGGIAKLTPNPFNSLHQLLHASIDSLIEMPQDTLQGHSLRGVNPASPTSTPLHQLLSGGGPIVEASQGPGDGVGAEGGGWRPPLPQQYAKPIGIPIHSIVVEEYIDPPSFQGLKAAVELQKLGVPIGILQIVSREAVKPEVGDVTDIIS